MNTDSHSYFTHYFEELNEHINNVNFYELQETAEKILEISKNEGMVHIVGNGGSAAIASHLSVDFTKTAGIRAQSFNESSLITCFANDYGYEKWAEKALDFYARENDLLIAISSSGASQNILNCCKKAIKNKIFIVTFSGFSEDNPLAKLGNINFYVNSNKYNMVENTHQAWALSIVDFITRGNN